MDREYELMESKYMRASLFLEIISVLDLLLLEVAHVGILRVDQILHLVHLLMVFVLAALELSLYNFIR